MEWTAAIPTAPGFYWHRAPGERVQVCEVLTERHGGTFAAFPIGRGHYDWLRLSDRVDQDLPKGSEWCGPIQPPTWPTPLASTRWTW